MTEWTKEECTNELRWIRKGRLGPFLQQKWKITKGGTGKVTYEEEWRDVPVTEAEQ